MMITNQQKIKIKIKILTYGHKTFIYCVLEDILDLECTIYKQRRRMQI